MTDTDAAHVTGRSGTESSEGRRVAGNFLWNLSVGGWGLLLALFSTPYVVHRLGPESYGIYALLGVLLAYLAFSELGLGRAVERHGAKALGCGEPERLRTYFETALWLQCGVAVVLGTLLAIAGPLALGFFKIPEDHLADATLALRVIALGFAVNLLLGTAQAPLRAHQAFATLGRIGLVSQTLLTGLVVGAVTFRPTVVAVVSALALASVLRLVLTLAVTMQRIGGLRFTFDRSSLKDLLTFGGWLTASSVLSPVLGHAEKLLLGALVGASALTYYMVPFRALSHFGLVSGALSRALFPRLSTLEGQGRRASMWHNNVRATSLLGWILLPPFALLAISGQTLLTLWMGADFAAKAAPLLPLLLVGAFINLLAWNAVALIQAQGRPVLVTRAYALEACLYLPLAWLLMGRFGLLGAALAWCSRAVLDSVLLWGIAATQFRKDRREASHRGLIAAVAAGITVVASGPYIESLTPGIPGRLSLGFLAASVLLILGWTLVFTREERRVALGFLQRIRPRPTGPERIGSQRPLWPEPNPTGEPEAPSPRSVS